MASRRGSAKSLYVKIGNAKIEFELARTSPIGDEFVVDMKINGQGLPATDLESFLPALGINLPSGSKLTAGTLSTNLHVTGPTNKLVTDGTIGLFNGKLSGFDLGPENVRSAPRWPESKRARIWTFEKFTSNVHMAPTGLRADNLNLVVPALGTVVGSGTLDSKNNMDFKLVAT